MLLILPGTPVVQLCVVSVPLLYLTAGISRLPLTLRNAVWGAIGNSTQLDWWEPLVDRPITKRERPSKNWRMRIVCLLLSLCLLAGTVRAQDYADAARGAGRGRVKKGGGGASVVFSVLSGVAGSVVGGWLQAGRLRRRHDKEKKDLLKYIQSIDEVFKAREAQWQAEYQKLYKAYEGLEQDTIKRDYEEFKAPDTDGDDQVSREEFAIYVRKYLSSFPELSEKDFPKFDEFDLNGDGIVSFAEWQQFLQMQKLAEAKKGAAGKLDEGGGGAYSELLNQLYDQTSKSSNFDSLQDKAAGAKKGGKRLR